MAPAAITPPAVEAKRPTLQRVPTANLGTKRKIICFSGGFIERVRVQTVDGGRLRWHDIHGRHWPPAVRQFRLWTRKASRTSQRTRRRHPQLQGGLGRAVRICESCSTHQTYPSLFESNIFCYSP